jgi:uncharacterized protein (AIM24 family)
MTHWGSSEVTGRGLLALVGSGQLYSVELKPGEQYIAHPRCVGLCRYSMSWVSANQPVPATSWLIR